MTALSRDQIPAPAARRPLVPVEVPAWGGTVYVRKISAGALEDIATATGVRFSGLLVIHSACLADGTPIWTPAQLDDVLGYPGDELKPLIYAALEVNGFTARAGDAGN